MQKKGTHIVLLICWKTKLVNKLEHRLSSLHMKYYKPKVKEFNFEPCEIQSTQWEPFFLDVDASRIAHISLKTQHFSGCRGLVLMGVHLHVMHTLHMMSTHQTNMLHKPEKWCVSHADVGTHFSNNNWMKCSLSFSFSLTHTHIRDCTHGVYVHFICVSI